MSRLAPRASEVAGVQGVTGWAGAQEGFQRAARVGGSGWASVQPGWVRAAMVGKRDPRGSGSQRGHRNPDESVLLLCKETFSTLVSCSLCIDDMALYPNVGVAVRSGCHQTWLLVATRMRCRKKNRYHLKVYMKLQFKILL